MKKSLHLIRQKYSAFLHPILCIFLLFFALACGDTDYSSGDNRSSESGSISFSVEWQGAPTVKGAAGSVVTKSVPPFEIWGGNPAKYIRKRKL